MLIRAFGLAVATALLVGCTASAKPTRTIHKELHVVGSEEGVRRFTALQNSRRPALAVSHLTFRVGQEATAVVSLPPSYNGKELVQTTREAIAAGLRYEFREVHRFSGPAS
jgi:hypothetical protein